MPHLNRWRLWCALFALVAAHVAGDACAHPQDGPHADIRMKIDETGVHAGMMINLAFIDEMVDFPRESPDAVAQVEEGMLRELLTRYFVEQNVVEIDGMPVAPVVQSFEMIRPDVSQLYLFPRSGMRGLLRARLELDYPAKSMPRTVRFVWTTYPPNVLLDLAEGEERPPMAVEAQLEAEGTFDILHFTREAPEVMWHGSGLTREERFLDVPDVVSPVESARLPALSLATAVSGLIVMLVGVGRMGRREKVNQPEGEGVARPQGRVGWTGILLASGAVLLAVAPMLRQVGTVELKARGQGLPTEAQAKAIFEPLHANIYRAFDYEQRGEIYDALARSVSGELLESLYDQIYTSLVMYEEGGAVSKVSSLRLMRDDVKSIAREGKDERPVITIEAQWQVDGVVYHEGHSHRRTNEYVAEYQLARLEEGWRITANRVLSQERLDPQTGERPRPTIPDGEI